MQIAGHTFLVTGGASGLGAATARRLVAAGGNAVIADTNAEQGKAFTLELGARAGFSQTDVTDESQVAKAVAAARDKFGALHGAVSCAGIAPGERVLGKSGPHRLDSFRHAIEINLVGTFNVLRLAAQAMAENKPDGEGERGVIVNTASVAAFDGQIGQAAYSASKAGVAGLTLPAARELARLGIRVMAIAPGIFETPMAAAFSPELKRSLAAQVPFPPRLGRPDEFAALVEHIIVNPMLNGEVIRLDGALRMAAK
ncbi:MAG: 3-hydroxy-2-methylbutyryl-CoA dehydrogenase [Betaproteobacteria bacterium RIFCSPLOWO2_02_FULL_67_26]|nr:MAG: 3-hydroxy-2-methylbutyryl-CoA dehydrogenase [Betaproteobacteria bacterium RIFCSPLOWO2_02_FULL_67_26]